MYKRIVLFAIFSLFSVCSIAEIDIAHEWKEDEVLVRFAPKEKHVQLSVNERRSLLTSVGGEIMKNYQIVPGLSLVKLPKGKKVTDAVVSLRKIKGILSVEPNYKIRLHSILPADPHFANLWGLHNVGQSIEADYGAILHGISDADIDAPEAWDIHTGGDNIIVAVLDTGIDYTHPDLAANMWVNQAELTGDPNSDDDGNGYKDDIYGYDFADRDSDPNDYMFHGTHVAGTIGAVGNNNIGVAGICWNVKLMSVKIFPNYGEETFINHTIEGIQYAVNNGAKILSNSWGGYIYSSFLRTAILNAQSAGVLFVASAGNDGEDNDHPSGWVNYTPAYPASYDCANIIAVMASEENDRPSVHWDRPWMWTWATNYGAASVDIAAPGTDIFSTFPTYPTIYITSYGFSTHYETISGTSMAAPHVAGACALVWSKYPHLQALQVKQLILDSADRLASLDGLCVSEGRLNLRKALLAACPITVNIEDDIVSCVSPYDQFTYSVSCTNPTVTNTSDPNYFGPAQNIALTLYLPQGVDYPAGQWSLDPNTGNFIPPDPGYDPQMHSYTWLIDYLHPLETQIYSLEVLVNEFADPGGKLKARAVFWADNAYTQNTHDSSICCYNNGVIYVDSRATGFNTGVSWANAYTDLSRALERAAGNCGTEIFIAQGIYIPGSSASDTFVVPAGVSVYGGYAGSGPNPDDRRLGIYQTILSGRISQAVRCDTVVKMSEDTLLDGCVVREGSTGILCSNVNATIKWCRVENNGYSGIHHLGSGKLLTVENCGIHDNQYDGILTEYSTATIINSLIYNNGSDGSYYGIHIGNPSSIPTIRNNTIVHNVNEGVRFVGSNVPDIRNCIIWKNNTGLKQLKGLDSDQVYYSCVQDCNDVNYEHNINDDPGFVYDFELYGFYHIKYESPCRNAGDDTYVGQDEIDMDIEVRVQEGTVDIGADEVSCEDTWHEKDWTYDGVINLEEFAVFSAAWLSHDPNDPAWLADPNLADPNAVINWNPICNFDEDYDVDIADFILFYGNWLWQACWRENYAVVMYGMSGGGESMMMSVPETSLRTELFLAELTADKTNVDPLPQKSIEQQIIDLQETAQFLDKLWLEEELLQKEIDADDWQEFMDKVYKGLDELQNFKTETFVQQEDLQ